MRKYFLLAAISAAMFLTACGENRKSDAETHIVTSEQTSSVTVNSIAETEIPVTVPETEAAVAASSACVPESEEHPATDTSVCTESVETIEIVEFTTVTEQEETAVMEESEDIFFSATVIGVEEKAILVQMNDETFIGEAGIDVYLFGSYDVGKGDIVNIIFTEEVGIDDAYPPEIKEQFIVSIEKDEYADGYELPYPSGDYDIPDVELDENEHVAYVTSAVENKNGGYSLTVEAYDIAGYNSPVPVFLHSETEISAGDWIKVGFAPDTCFMETSPLQVDSDFVLSIEVVDY